MTRPIAKTVMTMVALVAALVATPAAAAPIDVVRDCSEDGSLDRSYSQDELSGALRELPSDLDEYTDCRSVIRAAQLAGARGKQANGRRASKAAKVDAAAPPSPDEQRRLARAADSGAEVTIGDERLKPGAQGVELATAGLGTDLPAPMLLLLVSLGVGGLASCAIAAQRRWPRAWQAAGSPFRRLREGARRGISRRR